MVGTGFLNVLELALFPTHRQLPLIADHCHENKYQEANQFVIDIINAYC